jgi:hypothetical protein
LNGLAAHVVLIAKCVLSGIELVGGLIDSIHIIANVGFACRNISCSSVISLAIFMTLSISACKKYPPEIEKVCNDVICSDGCKKSCDLDNDFKSYEKSQCVTACKIGCKWECKDVYMENVPDYDPKLIPKETLAECESACKETCSAECKTELSEPSELVICEAVCVPGCAFNCGKEAMKEEGAE